MNISYMTKEKGEVETLKFNHSVNCLGCHVDTEGIKWDVHMIVRGQIFARQMHETDHRYSTCGWDKPSGVVTTKWKKYNVEVIGK